MTWRVAPSKSSPPDLHLLALFLGSTLIAGCAGSHPDPREILEMAMPPAPVNQSWHTGPDVHVADTGPARFVGKLNEAFRVGRAMETVRFTDRFYRAPANDGFEAVLEHLEERLRAAGFGGDDPRLHLSFLKSSADHNAWTPVSAELALLLGEEEKVLHAFDKPEDVDRCMLPIGAPSGEVTGEVAFQLDELKPGMILVTETSVTQALSRAQARGAAAVISASLRTFNVDPSGRERHLDAIHFRSLRTPPELPVAQISKRSYQAIVAAAEAGSRPRLRFKAKVKHDQRPLRTLVATIEGADRAREAVGVGSHVQEPGACDNASGVAGLLESAVSLAELLQKGELEWPSRTIAFLWGDEFRQTSQWLDATEAKVVAGVSSDMTGQSKDTGAIALLERMPDPGALHTLPPDAHTPWGAGDVEEESLKPNGLSVIARCAMIDVGLMEGEEGWDCADHPWEGGSDHDVFIERDIPAVLFWHFTDFTYHTSLDRLPFVDPQEIRRTAIAILSTALAVADPEPGDLDRYLRSLQLEEDLRLDAAREAENEELVYMWKDWCRGAREWLRNECLGIEEKLPESPR